MVFKKYVKTIAKKYPAIRKRYKVYYPALRQLGKDVRYLKGLINSEPMSFLVQDSNNFDYNGVIISLSSVIQGDTEGQRTGNRILPRYLNVNFHVNQGINATYAAHVTHRFVLFRYWGEQATSLPNVTPGEILTTVGSQFAPLSHLNEAITGPKGDRVRRIQVLRNEQFTLDQVSRTMFDLNYNIECNSGDKKEHIEFRSSATEQPISGGFYILLINDNATSGQQAYWLESNMTFYDN